MTALEELIKFIHANKQRFGMGNIIETQQCFTSRN